MGKLIETMIRGACFQSLSSTPPSASHRFGRDRRFPGLIRPNPGTSSLTPADSFLIRGEAHPSATSGWPTEFSTRDLVLRSGMWSPFGLQAKKTVV